MDATLGLMLKGYPYLLERRPRGEPAVELRLLGQRVLAVAGPEGVDLFYDEDRLRRAGAVPGPLRRTLFGDKAVHELDGEAHRQRRALFTEVLDAGAVADVAGRAAQGWREALERWKQRPAQVVLFDEAVEVFGRAAQGWAGVPAERVPPGLSGDLAAVVDGFGSVGRRHLRARRARRRLDHWATALVRGVRRGHPRVPAHTPLGLVASQREPGGTALPAQVAGVELVNLLRPVVAVAHFAAFAALAFQEHPECREWVRADPAHLGPFVHEVRRLYPFVPMLAARARRPFSWRGHQVGAGQLVVLDVYGTLHDPTLWRAPFRFDPARFTEPLDRPEADVAQGGGPPSGHRCPGELLTLELLKGFVAFLADLDYYVADQDLVVPLNRIPSLPRSGFVIVDVVRRGEPHRQAVSTGSHWESPPR